jgi:hypothetical protein
MPFGIGPVRLVPPILTGQAIPVEETLCARFFCDHNPNNGSGHKGAHKHVILLILLEFLSHNIPCAMVLQLIARSP